MQHILFISAFSSDTPNSPLGRGLLTGQIKSSLDIKEGDYRRRFTRFKDEVSLSFNLLSQVDIPNYVDRRISVITSS